MDHEDNIDDASSSKIQSYIIKDRVDVDSTYRKENDIAEKFGNQLKGHWDNRAGFILSCVGFTVGVGNICKFPYKVYKYGGLAFIIVYLILLFAVGLPLLLLELTIGQFTSRGVTECWHFIPGFKGIGYIMVLICFLHSTYQIIVVAWAIYYLISSFRYTLPWNSCNNYWNDNLCKESNFKGIFLSNITREMSSEQFFYRHVVLRVTSLNFITKEVIVHEENLFRFIWYIAICLFVAWLICAVILLFGIKIFGRTMYVFTTYPCFVLIVLFCCFLTLEGSSSGIKQGFAPNLKTLFSLNVWYEAAEQIFYSLSIGFGGMLTLASYNQFHENIEHDVLIIGVLDFCMKVLGSIVTFQVMGFMTYRYGKTIAEILSSSAFRLAFMSYLEALTQFKMENLFCMLFFVLIVFVGISDQVSLLLVQITAVSEDFPWIKRKPYHRMYMVIILHCTCCLLSMIFVTKIGSSLYIMIDSIASSTNLLVIGFLESFTIIFVYGIDNFARDFHMMVGSQLNWYWRICLLIFVPIVTLILAFFRIYSNVNYKSGKFDSQLRFSQLADFLGWLVCGLSLLPLPIYFLYYVIKNKKLENVSTMEVLESAMNPDKTYGPFDKKHWKIDPFYRLKYKIQKTDFKFIF